MTKTKPMPQTPPKFVAAKLREIRAGYFLDAPPVQVEVNAPRALMQTIGEGWSQGIAWMLRQPLYAAAPDLLRHAVVAAEILRGLRQDKADAEVLRNHDAAIAKATGEGA